MLRDRILKKLEEEKLDRQKRIQRTKAVGAALMAKKIKTGHETVKQNVQGRAAAVKGEAARDPSNPTGRADPEMRGWLRGQSQDAIAQDASRKPKPKPKVDDSTQPSLASIIRKKIEEVFINRWGGKNHGRLGIDAFGGNGGGGNTSGGNGGGGNTSGGNRRRRGTTGRGTTGRGNTSGGTSKSDDGVDAYQDNREEMGGPRTI